MHWELIVLGHKRLTLLLHAFYLRHKYLLAEMTILYFSASVYSVFLPCLPSLLHRSTMLIPPLFIPAAIPCLPWSHCQQRRPFAPSGGRIKNSGNSTFPLQQWRNTSTNPNLKHCKQKGKTEKMGSLALEGTQL